MNSITSPGKYEEQDWHAQVGSGHVDPYIDGERVEKCEETGLLFYELAVEDADTCEGQHLHGKWQ